MHCVHCIDKCSRYEKFFFTFLHFGKDRVKDGVDEGKDGAAKEESKVAANLANEAGPVADDILLLVGEEVVLEPYVDCPVSALFQPLQVVALLQNAVGEHGPGKEN